MRWLPDLFCSVLAVASAVYCSPSEYYAMKYIQYYGTNGSIHGFELDKLISDLNTGRQIHEGDTHAAGTLPDCSKLSAPAQDTCLKRLFCLSSKTISSLYKLPHGEVNDTQKLREICPAMLYQIQHSSDCEQFTYWNSLPFRVWGFAFLFMTVINVSSLVGVVILPFKRSPIFKWMIQILISFAVGTMASCSVLFLIPDALALLELDHEQDYVWKAMAIMGGFYLFFNVERILKLLAQRKKKELVMENIITVNIEEDMDMVTTQPTQSTRQEVHDVKRSTSCFKKTSNRRRKRNIAPVAWMIITGDALHRLVDGMTMGAALEVDIFVGVGLAVAIACEEFPHGLGDFAVLINSDMSRREAIVFKLVPVIAGYIGTVFGITIGENVVATRYLFSLAAGMFLYVALVDMLNDMNHLIKEDEQVHHYKITFLCLQNVGLLFGFGGMLLLAVHTHAISSGMKQH